MSDGRNEWQHLRAHPVITGIIVLCTLGGVSASFYLAPSDWSLWRTIIAGLCAGAFGGLCIVAPKMFT